ncbi:hypothetical protein ACP4OV_007031 [Aristida adscensionis]
MYAPPRKAIYRGGPPSASENGPFPAIHGGVCPGGVKLAKVISHLINWPLVWIKAAEIVADLVNEIPGLNEMRQLPLSPAKPANVLPTGMSSSCRRGLKKKSSGRMPADALARSFLSKKRSSCQADLPLERATMTRLAVLIDECLQAGKCPVLNDKFSVESSYTEG